MRIPLPAQFLVYWAGGMLLQVLGGMWSGGWSLEEDEASHFLTGLMVRDYLAAHCPWPPIEFATRYHAHYPRIGLGHWPPLFYAVQGIWMLIFPAFRDSVLVLQAAITAAVATGMSRIAAQWIAPVAGPAVAVLWLAAPMVRHHGGLVMTELLIVLLTAAAAWAYVRYLESPGLKPAAAFGLLTAAALLTKGTGVVLALVPPLSVLMLRRWEILRRRDFWLPAVMVPLLCAPWYLLVPGALHERTGLDVVIPIVPEPRFFFTLVRWLGMVGLAAPLALAGLVLVTFRAVRTRDSRWAVCLALLVAVVVLRQLVLVWSPRHLVTAVPVVLLAVALAADRLRVWRNRLATVLVTGACLAFSLWQYRPPARIIGAADVAAALPSGSNSTILAAGSTASEGALICEIALRDHRPGHTVLRAGKTFHRLNFSGEILDTYASGPDQVRDLLRSRGVGFIVEDLEPKGRLPGWDLLRQTLDAYPDDWEPVGVFRNRFRMWRARPSAKPSPL